MNNVQQLFQMEIQKLHSTETTLLQGMTQFAASVQSDELRQAFETHRTQTEEQIRRLEQVAQIAGFEPGGQVSQAAQALVEEAQQLLQSAQPSPVTDAMIIGAAQKGEHLEIACYGTVRTLAQQIGMNEAADLLEQTLNEEKETDAILTRIAESQVNQEAASGASAG